MPITNTASATAFFGTQEVNDDDNNTDASEKLKCIKMFLAELGSIRPLLQACRKTIRRAVGFGVQEKVKTLPLPEPLKIYLLLGDMHGF